METMAFDNSDYELYSNATFAELVLFLDAYAINQYAIAVITGPVIWTLALLGIVLNCIIIPVELVSSKAAPPSLLAAGLSVSLLLKSLYSLSIATHVTSEYQHQWQE